MTEGESEGDVLFDSVICRRGGSRAWAGKPRGAAGRRIVLVAASGIVFAAPVSEEGEVFQKDAQLAAFPSAVFIVPLVQFEASF